jgi:hypothetical protein
MVFIATFWAAVINLVLLVVALALHPASLDGFHWLRELPWPWFGTELLGMLDMQAVDAGALWALWICVSTVLILGSIMAYALLALNSAPAQASVPIAETKVAAMFDTLSDDMAGLGGFGSLGADGVAPAGAAQAKAATPIEPQAVSSDTPTEPAAPQRARDITASLEQIDPELGSSYGALLRELESTRPLK